MATPTVSENPEVQQQYATQVGLTVALVAALKELWGSVNPMASPSALLDYQLGAGAIVQDFSDASISLAADFYDAARDFAQVDGLFKMPLVEPPAQSLVDAGIAWAMKAEQEMADDVARIQKRAEAAMQKAVADSGRAQIVAAVAGDDKALGFRRVPRPGACYWCLLLAMRTTTRKSPAEFKDYRTPGGMGGPRHWGVYKSRASAGQFSGEAGEVNRYHNNCHCTVEPIFDDSFVPPGFLLSAERLYADVARKAKSGDKANAFRRALAAKRRGDDVIAPESSPSTASGPSVDMGALFEALANAGAKPSAAL
jgi:hypothetical protein